MTHRLEFNVKHLNQRKNITKLQIMPTYRQRIQMEFGVSRKDEIFFNVLCHERLWPIRKGD